MNKPRATVEDVRVLTARGPWKSKSGGVLAVPVVLTQAEMTEYLSHDEEEARDIPDIHGFRIYTVRDIPKDSVGGREFHRIRKEMPFTMSGSFEWTCEDVYGGVRTFVVPQDSGLYLPPYINHTYRALEDDSSLFVIANTLFIPEDATTHDTFFDEVFREIQTSYR